MKKVLFIIDDLCISGAQVHLARLMEGLTAKGMDVEVLALGELTDRLVIQIGRERITQFRVGSIRSLSYWNKVRQLTNIIRDKKPFIVHTYLNTANIIGVLAAKRAGVKHIISSRRDMGHFRTKFIFMLEKYCNRHVQKIVCVSNAARDKTIETEFVDPDKVVVLHSGVDTDHFTPEKNDSPTKRTIRIGMNGRMWHEIKGQRYLLEAATKALKTNKDIRFVLIGDGKLRESLEQYARQQKIIDYVDFRGTRNDIKEEIARLDIFAFTSLSEGFSNAIVEAMSMELPVIAFAKDGNLDIIENNINGYLVDYKDTTAVAQKILYLAEEHDRRNELGAAARKTVLNKFTLDHMVERYKKFYETIMKDDV